MYRGGAVLIPRLYHASLWAVSYVNPVLHAGCGVLVECLMCSNGRVQSGCGRFGIACDRCGPCVGYCACALFVHGNGVPVGM